MQVLQSQVRFLVMTVRALFVATFVVCPTGAATAAGLEAADAPCLPAVHTCTPRASEA